MRRGLMLLILASLAGCTPVVMTNGISVSAYVYKIGVGDKLVISVFGEDQLKGEYAVNAQGAISFPLVGDVPAQGKSVTEFREELRTRLGAQYLKDPRLSVDVLNFRPVYILGEVTRPGEFPFVERMSVFALVAKAGGFTYRADQAYVYIRHETEADEQTIRLTSATSVQPGDTIRIPERRF
jgi:protein involved in polysaccharide export with SLBB domain